MSKHNLNLCLVIVLVLLMSTSGALAASSDPKPVLGGGGFLLGLWYPDFGELNKLLPEAEFNEPVFLFGGGGSGATVPGWEFGGFGGGGRKTDGNAELSVGIGGSIIRKTFRLGEGHWFIGGMFGGGGSDLYINNATDIDTVEEAIANPSNLHLTSGFFTVAPQIGLEVPVFEMVRFHATAGYIKAFGGEWHVRGGNKLSGGQVNWDGPFFQIGIRLGGYDPR